MKVMDGLRRLYGARFSKVFKTITADNGSEFAELYKLEKLADTKVFFTHAYSSFEKGTVERHNGLFRAFVPKGASIEDYSAEYILSASDELNGRPRKKLGYRTPEELLEVFLDSVFAA